MRSFVLYEVPLNAILLLISISPFFAIFSGIKKADQIVKKESLSKIDFANTKEYYRDVLKKYSVAELSYIDDFNIDYPKDIIVTLLSLVLKRKISITNDFINVVDFNDVELRKSEKYVLENISDGKVKIKKSYDIIEYVQEEALNDYLIKKSDKKNQINKFGKIFALVIVIVIILVFCFIFNVSSIISFLDNFISDDAIFMLICAFCLFVMFLFAAGPVYLMSKVISYSHLKRNSYIRTELGETINKQIEGLKKYIADFSILSEREQQELMIWDEYLIYSVLFNQNSKIVNDLLPLIETEIELGNVYYQPPDND